MCDLEAKGVTSMLRFTRSAAPLTRILTEDVHPFKVEMLKKNRLKIIQKKSLIGPEESAK